MSDSQKDSRQNAVIYIDVTPHFELTAGEIVYPIDVTTEGGGEVKIYAHVSPYESRELKTVLDRVMPAYKIEGRRREDLPGDRAAYHELVKKHYLGLSNVAIDEEGTEAPEDLKREFFDRNPSLQERIAVEGYGGVELRSGAGEPKPSAKLLLLPTRSDTFKVSTWQRFVDGNGQIVRIDFSHLMEKEAAGHRSRYDSATRNQTNIRTSEGRFDVNYDVLEHLYGNLVREAKGFCFEGAHCVSGNKEAWTRLMPLWHKLLVVNHQFDRTAVKN